MLTAIKTDIKPIESTSMTSSIEIRKYKAHSLKMFVYLCTKTAVMPHPQLRTGHALHKEDDDLSFLSANRGESPNRPSQEKTLTGPQVRVERETGLEPATLSLGSRSKGKP